MAVNAWEPLPSDDSDEPACRKLVEIYLPMAHEQGICRGPLERSYGARHLSPRSTSAARSKDL
jgi:hypothetical protein